MMNRPRGKSEVNHKFLNRKSEAEDPDDYCLRLARAARSANVAEPTIL